MGGVALFTRAWIEIIRYRIPRQSTFVALFTRAWIEITSSGTVISYVIVALFTRAWIEIIKRSTKSFSAVSPSSRGRGLK